MLARIATITARHWKFLLALNVLVLAAAASNYVTSPKVWTAKAQLILPDTTSSLDANLGTLGSLTNDEPVFSNQLNPLKVQAYILTSDALMQRLWASDTENSQFGLRSYKKLFEISPQEQSTTISLTVKGSSPELAHQRAIALIEAYQQRLNELRQTDGVARAQFSQKQLEQAQQRLNQAQMELAQFQKSSGLVNSEEQTRGLVQSISELTTAQAQAQAQALASINEVRTLSNRLGLTPDQAIRSLGLAENPDYQFIRQKLTEVEAKLVEAKATYTMENPRVEGLVIQRDELQRQLQQYITQAAGDASIDTTMTGERQGRATLIQQLILAESTASAQQRQATQLQSQAEQLNATLKLIPGHQAKLLELKRQYEVAEGVYKGLVAQIQKVNIDAFNAYPNVQVLDPPTVSSNPTDPKKTLIALNAFVASVVGSIALLLLLEARNPLLSPKDLQTLKFAIVVRIPRLKQSVVGLGLTTETEVEFQRLASAISLQPLKNRRLLVTSATMGEGKTTVTLGLATALVDLGFRVLLVDGDFRKAQLSHRLGYARELLPPEKPVQLRPSLDLVPTLPKQGKIVEMVTRGRFEESLVAAQSANEYDYILVDSAPVSLTSETVLMAAITRNVLFVVRPGISKRNFVNDSLAQLTQHNAELFGLAINGMEIPSISYTYRANGYLVKG
ncbi:MAG TPA: exopolysaccharide biosynthesis protein [Cyanobacteria bacterium UBA8803]|nr:exopolysaccharide biosynthesis protein [Cyanobacteria bacterium UBA9273]HBL62787.1 exopolysaccharide biosynthesis protein [Cyanobacteria bacterium UBA8803]